jgi:putative redox protein
VAPNYSPMGTRPDLLAARQEMKQLLRQAIESLPEAERAVYELRDLEEVGGEDTAARLGISMAAMKSRLHRARAAVRQYLDESALVAHGTEKRNTRARMKGTWEGTMEVVVEHLGAVQFEIKTRQHTMISDQPIDSGGDDEGMTPPELLLASLGSCAAFYAVDYLKRNQILRDGVKVRVTAEKVKGPFRLDNFRIELELPEAMDESHVKGLEEALHRCLIHNTLQHPPKIDFVIQAPVVA